ncbi:hypothetical protein RJT34_00234 [Clitoria ternatea]|uniref:Uncharacterized protein n=1 Tax=Clitoria ternatea TaxID=43366 RepID=A0AAN9KI00_CLITE
MASSNATSSNEDEPDINIILENLQKLSTDDKGLDLQPDVCICRVPYSLRSIKSEVFTPCFVGLGLYHHSDNLIFTDKMKFGMGKRVFKDHLPDNADIFDHCRQNLKSYTKLKSFYQFKTLDTTSSSSANDDHSSALLLFQLIVDSIFLLAFSCHIFRKPFAHDYGLPSSYGEYYILTGTNWRMPLVDSSAPEELSMDGLLRDIFMLENQIPFRALDLICRVRGRVIDVERTYLQNITYLYSPVHAPERNPVDDDHHLLGYMYQSITLPWMESSISPLPFPIEAIFGLCNRHGAGVVPYELMKPFSVPGLIGKGVPYSRSL